MATSAQLSCNISESLESGDDGESFREQTKMGAGTSIASLDFDQQDEPSGTYSDLSDHDEEERVKSPDSGNVATERALALFEDSRESRRAEAKGRHGDYLVLVKSALCEENMGRRGSDAGEFSTAEPEKSKTGSSVTSKDSKSGSWNIGRALARYRYNK